MKNIFCLVILFLLCFYSIVNANIINVSTVQELQSAVGEIKSGDTIQIEDGTYYIDYTLVINYKPTKIYNVAIIGKSGDRDAVQIFCPGMGVDPGGAPHVFAVYNVENLLIQDLTAGRTYNHPITVQGIDSAENVHFKNLHLIDAGEQFIKINNKEEPKCDNGIVEGCLLEYTDYPFWDGDSYYTQGFDKIGGGDNWIVRDCIIKNIRPHPDHLAEADGCGAPITYWQGGTNNLIERNIIINCRKGIELGISDGTGVDNSIVRNNIIYRSADEVGGDIGISVNDSPDSKVYNNTVILNGTFDPGSGAKAIEYRYDNSTNLEIKNNLCDGEIWVRANGLNPALSNNIYNADESWFVDAGNYDLHLRATATNAIDKGLTLSDVPDDIDKHTRPVNGKYDIGADEYGSSASAVEDINENYFNMSVSPNPFSESSVISWQSAVGGRVKIDIYNSLGDKITTLVDEYKEKGTYNFQLSIINFQMSDGIYFLQLMSNGVSVAVPVCVLRDE